MNDNDFDEIGRRLRDLEADPPKDGWKKIAPGVMVTPHTGKYQWLRRNGWKPLVLLIPVLFYSVYVARNPITERTAPSGQTDEQEISIQPADRLDADHPPERSTTEPVSKKSDLAETETVQSTSALAPGATSAELAGQERGQAETIRRNDAEDVSRNPEPSQGDVARLERISTRVDGPRDNELSVHSNVNDSGVVSQGIERSNSPNQTVNPEESKTQTPQLYVESTTAADLHQSENTSMANESFASEATADSVAEKGPSMNRSKKEVDQKPNEGVETVLPSRHARNWRVSGSYTPLFLNTRIDPVADDDILITDISNGNLKKAGYGIELGAGVSIARDLFLDIHISYMRLTQTTYYQYSTGEVDTLIATQLQDQSVVVSPVYVVDNAEVNARYSYGGVRVATTYYFWGNTKRRFSLTGSAGAYYMLSYDVKEKIDDRWRPVSDQGVNRMNYTLSAGVGYSRNLNRGWEITISPNVTTWLGKSGSGKLPYSQTQSSFGVNFMLSKSFIRER